ncbi:MAG: hypothetical protein ABIS18_01295 [Actinomycetota bacterium]
MPLVFAAVMPHGGALVPGVDDDSEHSSTELTAAMHEIGRSAASARLDALIIADPHGIGLDGAHSVTMASRMAGTLGLNSLEASIDIALAETLLSETDERIIPAVGVTAEAGAALPMEWGTFVPAWFLSQADALASIVVICPTRSRGLHSCVALGEAIADLAEASEKRIGFIASADNAHAHQENGPYGYHPSAKIFDRSVVELTKANDFEAYLDFDQTLMDEALPDSPWQLAILTGIFRVVPFKTRVVTYDCPSYFGMMVAGFDRIEA